ncbi:putative Ig domain-containing protein [Streptomyces sp. NPDC051940]|uniref:DUF7402 domain-containing protein n=1 Tax=Streptomyces sp. NPDC051940 TaxID=3155675 RepID=UPI0034163B32
MAATAMVLAVTVIGSGLAAPRAHAVQTTGTAPYLNQWAVSGPYTDPVVERSAAPVVPALGTPLSDPDGQERSTWQYFDDRVFNRNYDDYNDLLGYFDVKQGQATSDKWVVAASYVYSPAARTVQWRVGGSGVYNVYANDTPVGKQDRVASRVSKNGTAYPVRLNEGWNKLVIEIRHKNPGRNKNFLGFYTRLCDDAGNAVPELTYSVTGPNAPDDRLTVATSGLSIDRDAFEARNAEVPANDYPSNTLPYAYDENPYVGMVATIDGKRNTSGIAPQASPFTFQAAGGKPGYSWTVSEGQLPPGLTLKADGHIDGTVSDGAHGAAHKDYTFTVRVTDALGAAATRPYTITVRKNPVDWFTEGKMSALSHTTGTMPNLYDPNYTYDEWAQKAKEMGMNLLSTESLQNTIYYWPSPNANLTPDNSNKLYKYNALYRSADGTWRVKDRVMQAKQAAERYGLKFGVYVSSLYEGSEILESDIQGLVARYNPWYLFADGGPESYSNTDVAWSSARNYNDRVLIDANPNAQTGDQDITLHERAFWNSEPYQDSHWRNGILPQGRKVAHEEWNDPYTTALDVWTQYAKGNERDDWREAAKELINQYGHGYVMNYDSSITVTRGMDNLSSNLDNTNIFSMVPVSSQQLSDMRAGIVNWMDNPGGPDLRESMYGTLPYTLDYTLRPGWYTDPQKAIAHGQGPDWGYAMSRDQYVYLHMIKNQISGVAKSGFTGQSRLDRVGPFDHPVEKVQWLNKGASLPFTTEKADGKYYVSVDTSDVSADPIDTVIKIQTANPARTYRMTSVKLFSGQTSAGSLQLRAESYMNDYTNVLAPAKLRFRSDDPRVATVGEATGAVQAQADGAATITVTATYDDGVNPPQTETDTYPVEVHDGAISAALPLVGVSMRTNGSQFWGQFPTNKDVPVSFKGFTRKGGEVDILRASNVRYHYATVDGRRDNPTGKIVVDEVPAGQVPFVVEDNTMRFTGRVSTPTMYSYWADMTVDGKTYTSTRNYITLIPDHDAAAGIAPKVTSDSSHARTLSDGVINDKSGGNRAKWEAPASDADPSITYDLRTPQDLTRVNVFFNHHMPNADNVTYRNVPKKVKIEYSADGSHWTTGNETNTLSGAGLPTSRNTLAVPRSDTTLYAWEQEGLYYNYPVDPDKPSVHARYVRISFPGGGQDGSPVDVLEAQVFSLRDLTALGGIRVEPEAGADGLTATVDVTGSSFLGEPLDLREADLRITSDDPSVVTVGADRELSSAGEGRAKVTVTAELAGYRASDHFYADVDADGRMTFPTFLKDVKLALGTRTVKVGEPVIGTIDARLSTGEKANLSKAKTGYVLGDSRLAAVPGSNTIVLKEPVTAPFTSTAKAVVTLDGVTVGSDQSTITAQSSNIAGSATVTVSSVRDRNGDPDGDDQDDRYLGARATDGNRATSWAAKQADRSPWIRLQFPSPVEVDRVNLVDRGHDVNQIVEGLLEWEGGSKKVTGIRWDGQPDNVVRLDAPVRTSWLKFTVDPDGVYSNPSGAECGLAEFEVYEVQKPRAVVDYTAVAVDTRTGELPTLPARTEAVYSDGTTGPVDVTWEPVTADMVADEGWFTVLGTVTGTSARPRAVVNVGER